METGLNIEFMPLATHPIQRCPVCDGRGEHITRSQFSEEIISRRICRWCLGKGTIGG
jgi:DnaJ-class molecular chaperone